jgi:hypothetical protein
MTAANDSLRVNGIGRDPAEPRTLVIYFNEEPSDDDMRRIHDLLREGSPATAPTLARSAMDLMNLLGKTSLVWGDMAALAQSDGATAPGRVPLTDEQIEPLFRAVKAKPAKGEKDDWFWFAWGVEMGERAHGIQFNGLPLSAADGEVEEGADSNG